MKKIKSKLALISLLFFIVGCQTYHMSTQSLLEQFANTQKEKKVTVFAAPPFFFPGMVTGNSLREVIVLNKNDQKIKLPVTPHTGIRITKKDGSRKTFYFNTLIIQDSIITGENDHLIGVNIKPIKLNDIHKIELQP